MLEAVLLDLDNTMFLFDEPDFYKGYLTRIVPYFKGVVPPDEFKERLRRSLRALRQNDGRIPNSLCFLDTFCYRYRSRMPAIWQRFLAFYESEYDRIPVKGHIPVGLHEVIDDLTRRQLTLVVASNPVFPLMAQEKRLAWTGLKRSLFNDVTHLENMSYVKPCKGYYLQICEMLDISPARCLMVGNDPVYDMAAASAGLNTYLTTDALAGNFRWAAIEDGCDNPSLPPDFKGPLSDLPNAVRRLMN